MLLDAGLAFCQAFRGSPEAQHRPCDRGSGLTSIVIVAEQGAHPDQPSQWKTLALRGMPVLLAEGHDEAAGRAAPPNQGAELYEQRGMS